MSSSMESFSACLNRSCPAFIPCETTLKVKNVLSRTEVECLRSDFGEKYKQWILYFICSDSEDLEIELCSQEKREIQSVICISLIDSGGMKEYLLPPQIILFDANSKDFKTTFEKQQLRENPKLLRNGDLWLHCEIATEGQFHTPDRQTIADNLKFRLPVNDNEDDLTTFLSKLEKFSDVIIVVAEKEIKAHKAFLAMRSPVFAAMFESEMKEQKQNRVVISDMDYETTQKMLLYIYTGKTPNLSDMADRLLMAADKYSLDALKITCQKQLSSTISKDTVIQLMALADLYNANLLKDKLNEFITENFKQLMDKTSWQKLLYEASSKQYLDNKES